MKDTYILGIESSCDETSVSIVKNGTEDIATSTSTQIDIHKDFGGVVPEIASRHHVKNVTMVLEDCFDKANMTMDDIDAIAITYGPGLIGSLLIGLETAKTLADEYIHTNSIDTIVCLEETSTIGAFMAEHLSDSLYSMSRGNNISVVTPEYHPGGAILFRDNMQRMVKNSQVLILAPSITSGKSVKRAIEAVLYYGGTVCGICSVFSSINKINGVPVKTIFTSQDLPDYRAYAPTECPMCKAGQKIEAIVNSYGYSRI